VPAFTASVIAPPQVVVTSPVAPGGGAKLNVSSSSDLTMSWTGGGVAQVTGGISASYASGSAASVTCTVPASAGTLTLPASLIAQLPPAPMAAGLFASSYSKAQVVAGNYAFILEADSDANNSSNALYSVQIHLN
jgi:hypothetical protein